MIKTFQIVEVSNGFILNIAFVNGFHQSRIYTLKERMTMFAHIDNLLRAEPAGSKGMEHESTP